MTMKRNGNTASVQRRKYSSHLMMVYLALVILSAMLMSQLAHHAVTTTTTTSVTPTARATQFLAEYVYTRQESSNKVQADIAPLLRQLPTGKASALPAVDATSFPGSFADYDRFTVSPALWKMLIQNYNIHSFMDIGCGRGVSTAWFVKHGLEQVLCVEGHASAVRKSMLSKRHIVQHDFTHGPWWPSETYDAAWAIGFVQEVPIEHHLNYMTAFRKAALIFVTTGGGGTYSSDEYDTSWWIDKFQLHDLHYHERRTEALRLVVEQEIQRRAAGPNGMPFQAQALRDQLLVFVNPAVASLPQHAHLFVTTTVMTVSEESSRNDNDSSSLFHRPIALTPEMDAAWEQLVAQKLGHLVMTKTAKPSQGTTLATVAKEDAVNTPDPHQHVLVQYHRGNISLENIPVLPVSVWPLVEFGAKTAESQHIMQNGIDELPYLQRTDSLFNNVTDPNLVWVGDMGHSGDGISWETWCRDYYKRILSAQATRKQNHQPVQWPIFILDFTDVPSQKRCLEIEHAIGLEFVHYIQRSIVRGRKMNKETGWVKTGYVMDLNATGELYRHIALPVRTDTVETLQDVLQSNYNNMTLMAPIELLERPVDVTHFWPTNDTSGVSVHAAQLRHIVSKTLKEMGENNNLNVFVGLAGEAVQKGRRGVNPAYIERMLQSKIVVVTQHDYHEDHYRLFEALTSGALVMTDRMLSLPKGLQNGTSIIEVTSREDLQSKALYYLTHENERLEIAHQGRLVSMTQHRTWHRIEEIIFGSPVTTCSNREHSACPYISHVSEDK